MNRSVKVGTSMLGAKENKGNSFVPVEKRVCVCMCTHMSMCACTYTCVHRYILYVLGEESSRNGGELMRQSGDLKGYNQPS